MSSLRNVAITIATFVLLSSFQSSNKMIYDGTTVEQYLMDENNKVLQVFPLGLNPRVIRDNFFKSWQLMYKGQDGSVYHKFEFVASTEDGSEVIREKQKSPSTSSENPTYTASLSTDGNESTLLLIPRKYSHKVNGVSVMMVVRVSGLKISKK